MHHIGQEIMSDQLGPHIQAILKEKKEKLIKI
jgi:hypothetical protein